MPGRDRFSVDESGLTHVEPPAFRVESRFGVHPVGISTVGVQPIAEVRVLVVGSGGGTCKVAANVGGIVGGFLVGGFIGGLLEHAFYPRSDGVTGLVGGALSGAILGGLFVPRLCPDLQGVCLGDLRSPGLLRCMLPLWYHPPTKHGGCGGPGVTWVRQPSVSRIPLRTKGVSHAP